MLLNIGNAYEERELCKISFLVLNQKSFQNILSRIKDFEEHSGITANLKPTLLWSRESPTSCKLLWDN